LATDALATGVLATDDGGLVQDLAAERSLGDELTAAKEENAARSEELGALTEELGALTEDLRMKAAELSEVERDRAAAVGLGLEFKTVNEALKTENGALKSENGALETENEALKSENEGLKSENEGLTDSLIDSRSLHDCALEKDHEEAQHLRSRIEGLTEELSVLTEALRLKSAEFSEEVNMRRKAEVEQKEATA